MVIKAKLQKKIRQSGLGTTACDTWSHIRELWKVCKCLELQRMWSGYWKKSMNLWKTQLVAGGQALCTVNMRREIFQGDNLTPLQFVVAGCRILNCNLNKSVARSSSTCHNFSINRVSLCNTEKGCAVVIRNNCPSYFVVNVSYHIYSNFSSNTCSTKKVWVLKREIILKKRCSTIQEGNSELPTAYIHIQKNTVKNFKKLAKNLETLY